jgi:crossover junction endodeoxyribonuclease RuvC
MRILGIDPGLQLTGYGCLDLADPVSPAADPLLVEGGVIRLNPRHPVPQRLQRLHEELAEIISDLKPQIMVVEQLFSHYKHVRTAIQMGHARGVVQLVGQQHGLEIDELMPTEIKKAITGRGHASKHQMQLSVAAQLGLAEPPSPADVADALAIALCAARRKQSAAVTAQS